MNTHIPIAVKKYHIISTLGALQVHFPLLEVTVADFFKSIFHLPRLL